MENQTPLHVPADLAAVVAILNLFIGYFPVFITVVAGLMCITNYGFIFYDRFRKK